MKTKQKNEYYYEWIDKIESLNYNIINKNKINKFINVYNNKYSTKK